MRPFTSILYVVLIMSILLVSGNIPPVQAMDDDFSGLQTLQSTNEITGIVTSTTNLREEPNTQSRVLRSLPVGTEVVILACEQGESIILNSKTSTLWYQVGVETFEQEGYLWSGGVNISECPIDIDTVEGEEELLSIIPVEFDELDIGDVRAIEGRDFSGIAVKLENEKILIITSNISQFNYPNHVDVDTLWDGIQKIGATPYLEPLNSFEIRFQDFTNYSELDPNGRIASGLAEGAGSDPVYVIYAQKREGFHETYIVAVNIDKIKEVYTKYAEQFGQGEEFVNNSTMRFILGLFYPAILANEDGWNTRTRTGDPVGEVNEIFNGDIRYANAIPISWKD